MKIVYFNYMWDLWGACIGSTIKALQLLDALSKCGHEIKIHWRRDDSSPDAGPKSIQKSSPVREWLKKYLSKYLHEPNQLIKNFRSVKDEIRILEDEKPDLVISRLHSYVYSPAVVAKKTTIPYLIEIDSPGYEQLTFRTYHRTTKWLFNYIEFKHINAGRAAFTVSHQSREHYLQRGIPEDFITVIPNGVNPQIFSPDVSAEQIKDRYNLNNNVTIGFVGSFIFWHGVENLLKIIEGTLEKFEDVKFLMVGKGGPLEPLLRDFIDKNKLKEKVILAGYVLHKEVPSYISAMDIVLAPYPDLEFFYYSPVKIYEYMSSGKPVISARIGQIAEVIEDNKTGFLTKPNDIAQNMDIISELIKNQNRRKEVGKAARKEILEKHTWEKRGKQLSELCERLL